MPTVAILHLLIVLAVFALDAFLIVLYLGMPKKDE